MAYFIPSSIQKRLLRYALSKLELLDTQEYDLENLDITLGRTNTVDLHNVGLKATKLSALLNLPPTLRLDVARVLLVRIVIHADIWKPSIEVDIRGVRVTVRLDSQHCQGDLDKKKRHRSSSDGKSALPTTEDIAKSFLAEEPLEEKRELEDAILSQSHGLQDSDILSDDGLTAGTGVTMTLPSFLADYLQGVQDRLQVSISDVDVELKADIDSNEVAFAAVKSSDVSITMHCDVLRLDGSDNVDPPETRTEAQPPQRHISLHQLQVRLMSDLSFFQNLSRVPSVASQSPSQPRSPEVSRSDTRPSPLSATASPPTGQSLQQSFRESLDQVEPEGTRDSGLSQRRGSLETLLLRKASMSEGEHFVDAVGDDMLSGSMHSAATDVLHTSVTEIPSRQLRIPSIPDDQSFHDYAGYSEENGLGLLNLDKRQDLMQLSTGDVSASRNTDEQPAHRSQHRSVEAMARGRRLSATFPTARRSMADSSAHVFSDQPSVSHSQPTTGRVVKQRTDQSLVPQYPEPNEGTSFNRSPSPASTDSRSSDTSPGGLAESKLFTHEDARSMYMSAFSEAPASSSHAVGMPGSWDGPHEATQNIQTSEDTSRALPRPSGDFVHDDGGATPRVATSNLAESPSHVSTPTQTKSESPTSSSEQPANQSSLASQPDHLIAKQLLLVSRVDVWIPASHRQPTTDVSTVAPSPTDERLSSMYRPLPGAFSMYQSSHHPDAPSTKRGIEKQPLSSVQTLGSSPVAPESFTKVDVGPIEMQLDIATARAVFKLLTQVQGAFERSGPPALATEDMAADPRLSTFPPFQVLVERLSLQLLEQIPNLSGPSSSGNVLFQLESHGVDVSSRDLSEVRLDARSLTLRLQDEPILCFESVSNSEATIRDQQSADIHLSYKVGLTGAEVSLVTPPVRFNVDVQRIDETLSCFGGLSGILELSASMSSGTAPSSSPAKTIPQRPRGVRFVGETEQPSTTPLTGLKFNAHLRGFNLLLTGQACGLSLETTSIKVVGRERAISASFSQLRLAGPYLQASDLVPPLNIRVEGTRIDFLFTPEETDLTKLVSLITPSRDRYDDNDDILLDTLLRQRQKGSLLRVNSTGLRLDLTDLVAVQQLQCLGEELAKLQGVTKYLPEDDRPGILIMLAIRDLKAKIPMDHAIGPLQVGAQGLQLGFVGIPPLFAMSIDSISLSHGSNVQLLTETLHEEVSDVPMLMVRVIGDEMVPTIKVKLHNVCAEYRVSTVATLLGLGEDATVQDLSASIATSVATVTGQVISTRRANEPVESGIETPTRANKSMHFEVLFRECALGLNPRSFPSKALFLMSDAKFHSKMPTNNTYSASFDIQKAYLLLVDDVANVAAEGGSTPKTSLSATGSRHVLELCRTGFVSMGTISKAQLSFRSWEDDTGIRLTEVNAKNELLVMESCADSTQTLISLLGALSPPVPPNKAQRYRTKVVPMEDMMASFTGQPVVESQNDISSGESDSDEDDFNIPVDMIGSFYAPTDTFDEPIEAEAEIIDAVSPNDGLDKLRDVRPTRGADRATLYELGERCKIAPGDRPFTYEDGYYTRQSGSKGMARQWNSATNEYGIVDETLVQKSPFKVHLRDVHVIWNLFDGYDWAKTRHTIEKAVYDVETKAEERRREKRLAPDEDDDKEDVIGDFLFNSIWIEVPANRDPRELARNINRDVDDLASETGSYATMTTNTNSPTRSSAPRPRRKRLQLQRSKHRKITFELRGVSVDVYVFPPDSGETQSSIDVRVADLEIFDHVPSSTWKKFATYMKDAGERELGKPMIRLELLDVKPVEGLAASEAVLRVSVLPLRLHVDQDALDFITRFFEFKDDNDKDSVPSGPQPFIQRLEVNTVMIKLDYKPKKIDYAGLRSGHTTEFMNFFILDDCDIVLRHCIIYGVSGFDRLHKTLNDIWTPDVKRNQLPTVLAGLAPVRPIVNVTSGVRDLVYVPLREYRKDGRIVRSVQKGAVAFARTTTSELARLGAKLAIGTQNVLQGAEDLLSPSPLATPGRRDDSDWDNASYPFSSSPSRAHDDSEERRATSNYADQPIGVAAGLRSAARSLERDLLTARDAIVAIPGEVMESESAGEAVGLVARRAPTVILRTARGASKAVGVALLGAGNALDADSRRRIEEKYKRY